MDHGTRILLVTWISRDADYADLTGRGLRKYWMTGHGTWEPGTWTRGLGATPRNASGGRYGIVPETRQTGFMG
jgi:hypothetical protein